MGCFTWNNYKISELCFLVNTDCVNLTTANDRGTDLPEADGLKDLILAAVAGGGVTALGHFLILGRNVVTRNEMQLYVTEQSPYARDSQYIRERLDTIAGGVSRLVDIERRLAKVEAKLDIP